MTLDPRTRELSATSTADPVELSSRAIDTGDCAEPTNRVTNRLSEVADGVAVVESFSHLVALTTASGLVAFDASSAFTGAEVVQALRGWSTAPVDSLIYTHGHIDHVGGSGAVARDAADRGHGRIRVVGHEQVPVRFQRYEDTNGYNVAINARQFGGVPRRTGIDIGSGVDRFLPVDVLYPDTTFSDRTTLVVGGLEVVLHHDLGETDDHAWAWLPAHRALCVGDFVTWVFPNAGNPQKVQRYPLEWARALRRMQAYEAELLLPAHGLPVRGGQRVHRILDDLAGALESLVHQTLELMNAGETLDTVVNTVRLPADDLARPWMQPVYDEPEFVVRNIWRLYGGWWGQNPALLKPAPEAALAAEVARLVGGVAPLIARAQELSGAGEHRLAAHLVELATQAEPDSVAAHGARADIYQARRDAELSLMSKGVFGAAARESQAVVEAAQPDP